MNKAMCGPVLKVTVGNHLAYGSVYKLGGIRLNYETNIGVYSFLVPAPSR